MSDIYFDSDVGYDEDLSIVDVGQIIERTEYTEPHLAIGISCGVVKMKINICAHKWGSQLNMRKKRVCLFGCEAMLNITQTTRHGVDAVPIL